MIRTFEFYQKNCSMSQGRVQFISNVIANFEAGNWNENEIRELESDGLIYCLCEGKYEVFKKLISPFEFVDENGEVSYKYLCDVFAFDKVIEFIERSSTSIMLAYAKMNDENKYRAEFSDEEYKPVSLEYAAANSVILYPSLREELLEAIYSIDVQKVMSIKIKDVLARQLCGTGRPIRTEQDVIYYFEHPVLFAGLDLFSKNIITLSNDTQGCYSDLGDSTEFDDETYTTNLIIDYDSLDEFNKLVADTLVKSGNAVYRNKCGERGGKELIIEVPTKRTDTVKDVSDRIMNLVSRFRKQDMIYGIRTVENFYELFCNQYHYLTDEEINIVNSILEKGYTNENILEVLKYFPFISYYYDSDEGTFWIDEYYCKKHKQYLLETSIVAPKKAIE